MMCHIMLDLETLGVRPNAVILSISAIHFDPYSDYIGRQFNQIIDIDSCLSYNLSIDGECFHFWLEQGQKARFALSNSPSKSLPDALTDFINFLKPLNNLDNIYLWGNGINFDNFILKNAYLTCNLEYPINYKNDRDVRTIVNLISKKEFLDIQNKIREQYNLIKHSSIDDAKFQILYLQKIFKKLNLRNYK